MPGKVPISACTRRPCHRRAGTAARPDRHPCAGAIGHLQRDDTTVLLLARGDTRTKRLWTYVRDGRPLRWRTPAALFFVPPTARRRTSTCISLYGRPSSRVSGNMAPVSRERPSRTPMAATRPLPGRPLRALWSARCPGGMPGAPRHAESGHAHRCVLRHRARYQRLARRAWWRRPLMPGALDRQDDRPRVGTQ